MASVTSRFYKAVKLSLKIELDNDEWEYNEEPHVARRREILAKHPQIKKLMGHDPFICVVVTCEILLQLCICCIVSLQQVSWLVLLICAYIFGATLNHSLGTAIHEIGHNLAFGHKRPWANRLLSIACNLPIVIPMAVSYKKYHTDHHRWLGHDVNDVDIPTEIESRMFTKPFTKILWLLFHPLIHGLRPFVKSPKPVTHWELLNIIVCISFDLLILRILGPSAIIYLLASSLFGFGLHPMSGHFISEHYLFSGGLTTHSYYGPMNFITFNVGYHNEHHDFPYIPYRRLPEVRRIAPEYYDCLPHHTSWLKVLWHFVVKDKLGPHARGVNLENRSRPELYEEVRQDMETRLSKVDKKKWS